MGLQELDAIVPLPRSTGEPKPRVAENLAGGGCNPGRRRGGAGHWPGVTSPRPRLLA